MTPTAGETRRAVVAVTLASGIVGFTTTAVTVGTRGMASDLSLSTVELGWVVNAYLVSAAALVLVGGRMGDVAGRVLTFDLGVAVFAVGSAVGVVAPGFWVLIVARVLQGIGAALILPSSIEVIAEYSPPGTESSGFRWRGWAYASAFAIGPLFGGVLTDWFDWRWIFVLDALLVVLAGVIVWPLHNRPGRGTHRPTEDLLGAALGAVCIALVVLLAERLAVWDIASPRTLVVMGVGVAAVVVLGVVLVRHERRAEHPLMHPFVWRDRQVFGANVATVGASLGMVSLLYFFNLFAQSAATLDQGAVSVLVALVPFLVSMALCALFAHWFGHRVGVRAPVTLGLVLMVVGFGALTTVDAGTTESQLVLPLALAGIGAGIANASLTSVAVLHLPAGRMNEAAGWISLSRFLGSAMALAVGTAAFLSVRAGTRSGAVPSVPEGGDVFDLAAEALARDLSGPTMAVAHATTAASFSRTMATTCGVLVVVTVVAWWGLGQRPAVAPEASSPDRA
jgi:MFS family permease